MYIQVFIILAVVYLIELELQSCDVDCFQKTQAGLKSAVSYWEMQKERKAWLGMSQQSKFSPEFGNILLLPWIEILHNVIFVKKS